MNTHSHLEESLQRNLEGLRSKVAEMAGLAERALKSSVQALVERNRPLAYSVILRDQYIDELEMELDRLCLEFLVRHQPAGGHLRFVFTTIQTNKELERIGDYAESICRQALALSGLEPQPDYTRFVELGDLALHMLHDAVHAFLHQDADLAWRTMAIEERANTLRNTINAEVAELSRQGKLPTAALNPLLTVARRLERAADQTKNLCEEALFLSTGEFVKHKRAEAFRILFFDSANACLSQMAERIGNALGQPRFVFRSAGVAPQALSEHAAAFMAGKGLPLSGHTSKSLEQVPEWQTFQVIVALGSQARQALPLRSGKIVVFTWTLPDPSTVEGTPEVMQAAFESAYQTLESNIRELVGAILDEPQAELKL